MSSSPLAQLISRVNPPKNPVENGPRTNLQTTESALGLSLPESLVQFAQAYGTGQFGTPQAAGLVFIYNPLSPAFMEAVMEGADRLRDLKMAEGDSYVSFEVYPNCPGLLPLGFGQGGRSLFWLTEGRPETWPIVVCSAEDKFHRLDVCVARFLLKLFTGKIDCWGASKGAEWFKANADQITFQPLNPNRRQPPGS